VFVLIDPILGWQFIPIKEGLQQSTQFIVDTGHCLVYMCLYYTVPYMLIASKHV